MKTIKIKGMSCQHCARAVEKTLKEVDGVDNVSVDVSKGEASFNENKPVDMEDVKGRIKKAGYEVVG